MAQLTRREMLEMLGTLGVDTLLDIPSQNGKYNVLVVENYLRTYRIRQENHLSIYKGMKLQGVDIASDTLEKALGECGYPADSIGDTGVPYYHKHKLYLATLIYQAKKAIQQKNKLILNEVLGKYIGLAAEIPVSPYLVIEKSNTKYAELFEYYTYGDIQSIYGVDYKVFQTYLTEGSLGKSDRVLKGTTEPLYFKEEVDKFFYNVHFKDNTLRTKNVAKSMRYVRNLTDYHYASEIALLNGVTLEEVKTYPCYIYEIGNRLVSHYLYSEDHNTRTCAKATTPEGCYISLDHAKKLISGCLPLNLFVLAQENLLTPYRDTKTNRLVFQKADIEEVVDRYTEDCLSKEDYYTLKGLEELLNIPVARIKRTLEENNVTRKFHYGLGNYGYTKTEALKPFTSSDTKTYSVNKTAVELGITVARLQELTELGYIKKRGKGYLDTEVAKYKKKYGTLRPDYLSLGRVASLFDVSYGELLRLIEENKLSYEYKEPDTNIYFLSRSNTDKIESLLSVGLLRPILITHN